MILGYDWGYVIGGVLLLVGIGFAALAVVLIAKGRRGRVNPYRDAFQRENLFIIGDGDRYCGLDPNRRALPESEKHAWMRRRHANRDYLQCVACSTAWWPGQDRRKFDQAWRLAPWT